MYMNRFFSIALLVLLSVRSVASDGGTAGGDSDIPKSNDGWISLFDGKTLNGWKVNEHPETFKVENGAIVVNGPTSHLFYAGNVNDHDFKNFELKVDVMTFPGSNSGIYFHTQFQEAGFPRIGHEVQVNISHTDWRRSGSIYGIVHVDTVPVIDKQWYTQHIVVNGNQVRILIDGKLILEYNEPRTDIEPHTGHTISSGTFALQGHDPQSKVLFRNIRVKILPD
ncbi:glycosyl hydrolase [Parapedobacter pyrenivorans]|uniref:Glycosyl hydrolase n=2 Tax=Parapedobacter pyrenivorans TaxID=1305674 RepID=A0A917I2G9_9SPHI|nr:glycosyl hydrolase [Parapedobacter pyrenivorans]